jgi:hypothetical protein
VCCWRTLPLGSVAVVWWTSDSTASDIFVVLRCIGEEPRSRALSIELMILCSSVVIAFTRRRNSDLAYSARAKSAKGTQHPRLWRGFVPLKKHCDVQLSWGDAQSQDAEDNTSLWTMHWSKLLFSADSVIATGGNAVKSGGWDLRAVQCDTAWRYARTGQ